MQPVLEIVARAICAFIVLLVLARVMGRKQISHLTLFDYVTGITIGSIAATLSVDRSIAVLESVAALVTWTGMTMAVSYFDLSSRKARVLLDGQPIVVIKKGQVMEHALLRAGMDMDVLNMLLRTKDVFSIEEVDYAIMETNGQLSVMKRGQKQLVTKEDMGIAVEQSGEAVPTATQIIIDGRMIEQNLSAMNVTRDWIYEQLGARGISSISDVFYAEVQRDGTLYIDVRNDETE